MTSNLNVQVESWNWPNHEHAKLYDEGQIKCLSSTLDIIALVYVIDELIVHKRDLAGIVNLVSIHESGDPFELVLLAHVEANACHDGR